MPGGATFRIIPEASSRKFLTAQRQFYSGDPDYVPPMVSFEAWQVDRRNPFFDHAEVGLWLAWQGKCLVGRISTARDHLHDEYHGNRVGMFGHFEAKDENVARALLDHARHWLAQRGATEIRGPIDLSTNYRCGLLVSGVPGPPVISMPYNPPSYGRWIEAAGLTKAKDLLALDVRAEHLQLQRMERILDRVRERTKVSLRDIRMGDFARETEILWQLYHAIWERNWGFAPMSQPEFLRQAKDLKPICDPELIRIAEHEGNPIGFIIGLPDINAAIRACNGRLLPFGWLKFLSARRRIHHIRVITLGLLPKYRGSGIDGLLVHDVISRGLRKGYVRSETSWVLEDNVAMLRPIESMGGVEYRRYRVYEAPLAT